MMNRTTHVFSGVIFLIATNLHGQNSENCFFNDFMPKTAEIPLSEKAVKPSEPASVTVIITGDTLGKISKYVFGNNLAAWVGNPNNPKLLDNTRLLAPTVIRFPGGSWSDGYFWNGVPADVPDSIYDGTTYNRTTKTAKKIKFWGQTGKGGWQTTVDQYYEFIDHVGAQGLITINYGYARYGLSDNPVAKAAHLAAEWVRYDDGRTKFWEIGNENGGPWEYGWMIDTTLNKDGQPQIITGELYGKHFKVFVDSMKKAAQEIGTTIYIGGQVVIDGPTSWNFVDRTWNEGFFKEVGDYADFYIIHDYFGSSYTVKSLLNIATSEPKRKIDYLKQDFIKYNAYPKPIALTEYNMGLGATAAQRNSYINGMQATIIINEMIKNNYGLGARWLLISGEDGMFYGGSDTRYLYHPYADFYYLAYLQKFCGDHAISAVSLNKDILCYASKFASGETGVIVVNKGTTQEIISINTKSLGVGQYYYVYTFTGGTGHGDFSPHVYINGVGPSPYHWGPYDQLFDIKAYAYSIDQEIKFVSPPRSVQMIMIEDGDNYLSVNDEVNSKRIYSYTLYQNYPNPFNASTLIRYQLPVSDSVTLKVFDVHGKEIETLVNGRQNAGDHLVQFNATNLPSGVYFYQLQTRSYSTTKKLLLLK